MDIPHHTPSNKHILNCNLPINSLLVEGNEMGVFVLFEDGDVVEFNVEELIYWFENSFDWEIVFEFYGDFLVDEGLEEGVEH